MQYCAIVWVNCNHSKLNSLFIIQKRAVRNICRPKLKYITHTAPYFKNLHVLTIFDIYTLQVSQFMFKVTFNLLWTPAQRKRASMLYFAYVYLFIYFFMAALFSGPGERRLAKVLHVVDLECH